MTGRIFASAGVVLGVVSLVAVVWIKGVMRKPLFVPEPLETAGETAQGKSVALDPCNPLRPDAPREQGEHRR